MANLGNFDANQHEPAVERGPVPSAWYAMQIVNSEIRPTAAKDGNYLWLEYEMMEAVHPNYKGRKAWENLNIDNPNTQTVQIANSQLSAICRSVGVMLVQDSNQLHGKPLSVKLGIEPATEKYKAKNVVNAYASINEHFGTNPAATAPAQTVGSAPGAASKPPWQK